MRALGLSGRCPSHGLKSEATRLRPRGTKTTKLVATLALMLVASACNGRMQTGEQDIDGEAKDQVSTLRVATFNIWELSREKLDQSSAEGVWDHPQLLSAAEIIQRVRPDVMLLNEIDFDAERRENAGLFVERYLRVGQGGQEPIDYPHIFFEPSNTGVSSGHDFDNDGKTDGPADAYGFGRYPGQYAMALLSRLPINSAARTFQNLLWRDMPGHLMPNGEAGKPTWFDFEETAIFRLSSKSHWDVPIQVGSTSLHVLASHPTPPVFDGEEDHNGRRNFDEIRLWADYLTGGEDASYIVDDSGRGGALPAGEHFVIMGDLNADPFGDATYGRTAISQLLDHPRIQDPTPTGAGGAAVDRPYDGPPELRTAAYGRIDYVLPSTTLEVRDAGVFWPGREDPLRHLVDGDRKASDHALVWVDTAVPGEP